MGKFTEAELRESEVEPTLEDLPDGYEVPKMERDPDGTLRPGGWSGKRLSVAGQRSDAAHGEQATVHLRNGRAGGPAERCQSCAQN
jgi:hypothetical protein